MRLRRDRIDDDVVDALRLGPGDRVLAFATDPDGRSVVATRSGLHLQRRPPDYSRVDWHAIGRASFADGVLTVTTVEGHGRAATLRIPLAEPGRLPEVVRDRVISSLVLDQHVPLRGRRGVHVVARRLPDGDQLAWTYLVDDGLDLTDNEAAAAEAAVASVRAEYG